MRDSTTRATGTELPLSVQVAEVLVNKGGTLCALGRFEDAIAVYDDLLDRFGSSATELPLREQVADVLVTKGVLLGGLGRFSEAIAAVRKAGEIDPDSKTRRQVSIQTFMKEYIVWKFSQSQPQPVDGPPHDYVARHDPYHSGGGRATLRRKLTTGLVVAFSLVMLMVCGALLFWLVFP
jgi:tetratricopeptide (TPR) repeat protein